MTFPDVHTQMELDGAWVDVTTDVLLRDGIEISRGRPDEHADADPASCALSLRNDGTYSPRNPLSPYYGLLGRNTPLRVKVDSTTSPTFRSFSSGTGASTTVTVTKPTGATAGDALVAFHSTARDIADMTPPDGGTWTLLATLDSDLPDANTLHTNVWWRPAHADEPASYTFGQGAGADGVAAIAAVTGGVTPIVASLLQDDPGTTVDTPSVLPVSDDDVELRWVAGVSVGVSVTWTEPVGFTERVDSQSGTQTAAALATRTLASSDATGQHTFTASATLDWGHGFTVLFSSSSVRFCGETSSLPQRWDVSGNDVWTPVTAAGTLRRLGQGAKPVHSAIRHAYVDAGVLAYWPLEDGPDSVRFGSAISGHPAASVIGTVDPASVDTLNGSAPLPELSGTNTVIMATVPEVGIGDEWQVEFLLNIAAEPAGARTIATVHTTGTVARWSLVLRSPSSGNVALVGVDADGTGVVNTDLTSSDLYGGWVRISIYSQQSGGNVAWGFAYSKVVVQDRVEFRVTPANFAGTVGKPTAVSLGVVGGSETCSVGHLGVFGVFRATGHWSADHGWVGEKSAVRFVRLCREHDISVRVVGDPYDTEPMGPQRIATLLELLGDCATTDAGVLHETREECGLTLRTRVSRYNRPTTLALTYSAEGEVAPPLDPDEDDQRIVNDVTVTRRGGSSATATLESGPLSILPPPDGVGRYDTAITVDAQSGSQLEPMAWWLLHQGTWDEPRYPQVHVDMAALNKAGKTSLIADAMAVDTGERLTIDEPPAWLPPETIDQHAEGYTETLDGVNWDLLVNCTPAGPYTVAVYDTDRYDTAGSELAAQFVSGTDTSISVSTTSGPLWTTGAVNFDIECGGAQLTVTNISGASSPQTFTITQTPVNGIAKTIPAGSAVKLWRPVVYAL